MIVWTEEDDPEVFAASKLAQRLFRFFWREVFWDRRRIVPAYDNAVAKLAFIGPARGGKKGERAVEFMWVEDVTFDGTAVEGTLVNEPLQLAGLDQGDRVSLALDQLADWMLVRDDKAIGAFTVEATRRTMSRKERAEHDAAWGLAFARTSRSNLERFACKAEHPMAKVAAKALERDLRGGGVDVDARDPEGWTWLHHFALAGATPVVEALLAHGADPRLPTPDGMRASQLAEALAWKRVASILRRAEARAPKRAAAKRATGATRSAGTRRSKRAPARGRRTRRAPG